MKIFVIVRAEHDCGADKYDNHPVEVYTSYGLAHSRCTELEKTISKWVFDYYVISTVDLIK